MPRRQKTSKSESIIKSNLDLSEVKDTSVMPGMSTASTPCRPNRAPTSQQFSDLVSSVLALREAIEDIRKQGDEMRSEVNAVREKLIARDDEHASSQKPELVSAPSPSEAHPVMVSVAAKTDLSHGQGLGKTRSTTMACEAHTQPLSVPQMMPAVSQTTVDKIKPDMQSLPKLTKFDMRMQQPYAMPSLPVQSDESAMIYGPAYNYKLYPLPPFDGAFEEWPLFYACFKDTTSEFKYNNKQNLMRLNKALHGNAKYAVISLLIYPDDVPKVIDELRFNFGRPELLVWSQQEKVARIAAIPEHRLDNILSLSNQVRNMVALFKSAGCTHHLMNPTLLQQLISKLPPTKQFEWAKYAVSLDSFPSVETFSCWVADLAKVVNIMSCNVSSAPSTQYRQTGNARCQPGQAPRRVLHNFEARPEQVNAMCECCGQCHSIRDCEEFTAMSIDDKWKRVKQNHLCFGCLKRGHSLSICQTKRVCAIQGCKRMHNSLLHQNVSPSKQKTGSESREYLMNCHRSDKEKLFKIVPVIISGPSGSMSTYAMLDEGSSISLIEDHVAVTLGLRGHTIPLTLQWYGEKKKKEKARKITITIKGKYEGAVSYSLKNMFAVSDLSLPQQSLNVQDFNQWKNIPVTGYKDAKPVILLGLDNAFLGTYDEVIENGPHLPIAAKTKLGWIAFGPINSQPNTEARVVHIRPTLKGLHDMMEEYFSVECFGVKKTDLVMESDEDRRAREILVNTTKKVGNRYETGLLWKQDNIEFPSSFEMAYNRLLNTEKRMKRDAKYAAAYINEMQKYINKGYAYLLPQQEADVKTLTTWYLPHFGVINQNKPGKLRIVFDAAAVTSGYSLNSVLLKGPEHAQSLFAIMYRFRQGIIAVAADIQEMFSQVQIRAEDRNAQRFLWRDGDTSKPPDTYVMKSMTFGAACSPCCAEYVKNINAMVFKTEMPRGAKVNLNSQPNTEARVVHIRPTLKGLHDMMEEYFSVECFGVKKTDLVMESDEDRRAREILVNTTKKVGNRYETGLLWKQDNIEFPSSFEMAYNRLLNTEKRMKRDAKYAAAYINEMQKYINKGYAYLLPQQEADVKTLTTWYLPHFGVINQNKPGKLRIVFDAAAVTSGYSLNSVLLKGPEHAQSLFAIMYRFRQGIIAVAADIQEMFSQVQIRAEDRNAQRFLWRDGDTSKPPDTYVMKSMTFGAACSPCCAEYVKNINAMVFKTEMPRGAKAVSENMYVDDLVASFNSNDEAEEICQEAVNICAAAGFNLRSFVSNSKALEKKFNGKTSSPTVIYVDSKTSNEKVLGTFWNTADDTFGFEFKFNKVPKEVLECHRPPTKREMLGIVMSIFDPFGFLANIVVSAKLILQKTWKIAIQWDDLLPLPLCTHWFGWWEELKKVQDMKIPRCYSPILCSTDDIQLHIFVDASTSAYAAVAYLRIRKGNQISAAFVAAKTRCAPVKGMTIPRLELQAALLGCRLGKSIAQCHEFTIQRTVLWSDSQTFIQWIRSTTRQYKQFVACRIAEILTTTSPNQWHWLPTTLNVADEATRGDKPTVFGPRTKWLQGPEFLRQEENIWPNEDLDLSCLTCPEEETSRMLTISINSQPVLNYTRFSSYSKLLRVTAWITRYIHNIKLCRNSSEVRRGELIAEELSVAEKIICLQIQWEAYQEEIVALKAGNPISKSSEIFQLTPRLDGDGLLHVRGRIDAAYCLPITARQPIIMPRTHYVTRLLVAYYHRRLHHQNDQLVINEIRQKFWVPGARVILKSIKKRCSTCILLRAQPVTPLMGQLPPDRLTPYIRPFTYTGVDYCGPFMVAIGRRREKRWIALFTCLTTRAIHLEVAEDLSTDAFLICLRNFVNRRGTPVKIRSDNGTNFIGAQRLLKNEKRFFDLSQINAYTSSANISWDFNCPAYPNAGGCWERLIQCVKRLLARTLKEEAPKLETFRSVLIEAENIVNSRPLTDIPLTSEEDEPLTPNHFLMGCLNSTQTPSTNKEDVCLRKQWRIAQNLKDRFWKRWTVEYLPQLLRRPRWRQEVLPLKEEQLVLVCDPNLPRGQWQIGRIVRVFSARDGQVRSAEIRTKQGVIKRPANKLAALEFSESL